jgi:hypothetical protein
VQILDLINVIKSGVTGVTVYANSFPAMATDDIAFVVMTGGSAPDDTLPISRPSCQVVVRASSPAKAEANINAIYSFLHRKQFYDVGTVKVIQSTALNSVPIYLGIDENNRTIYSANFIFVTKE